MSEYQCETAFELLVYLVEEFKYFFKMVMINGASSELETEFWKVEEIFGEVSEQEEP